MALAIQIPRCTAIREKSVKMHDLAFTYCTVVFVTRAAHQVGSDVPSDGKERESQIHAFLHACRGEGEADTFSASCGITTKEWREWYMKRGESSEGRRKSAGKAKATMAEEDSKEQSKLLWASVCMCIMIKSI